MTRPPRHDVPDEHLDDPQPFPLTGWTPTRLSGNVVASTSADPYYETFSHIGRFPGAQTLAEATRNEGRGGVRLPRIYRRRRPLTSRELLAHPRREVILNLRAVTTSFGAVTNNQAAAFVGEPALADPRSHLVADLFASDQIALASPFTEHSVGIAGPYTTAYQSGGSESLRRLLPHLTWAEHLAITGNRLPPTTPVNLRHDLLAAEVALRASTYLGPGAVLGPHFSTYADLTSGCRHLDKVTGGADLTIVRSDGLRIAIELTATTGGKFKQKVQRIVRQLAASPIGDCGLVVVFLIAPSLSALDKHGDKLRRHVYATIAEATHHVPGTHRDRTADRIGVATWQEWFPGPLVASDRFARLTVDRPTGRAPKWEPRDLWASGEPGYEPRDRVRLRAVIENAALLGQTPVQIRHRFRPSETTARLVRDAQGDLASTQPLRATASVRTIGAAHGVAGTSYIPSRILGPTDQHARAVKHPVVPIETPAPTTPRGTRVVVRRRRTRAEGPQR